MSGNEKDKRVFILNLDDFEEEDGISAYPPSKRDDKKKREKENGRNDKGEKKKRRKKTEEDKPVKGEEGKGGTYPEKQVTLLVPEPSLTSPSVLERYRVLLEKNKKNVTGLPFKGGLYSGELSNRQPNGKGALVMPQGIVFEGNWSKGRMCGGGSFEDVTTKVFYRGEWLDDLYSGRGLYQGFASDRDDENLVGLPCEYVGTFNEGKRCGFGKQRYDLKDSHKWQGASAFYLGNWDDDLKSGAKGILYCDRRCFVYGEWEEGRLKNGFQSVLMCHEDSNDYPCSIDPSHRNGLETKNDRSPLFFKDREDSACAEVLLSKRRVPPPFFWRRVEVRDGKEVNVRCMKESLGKHMRKNGYKKKREEEPKKQEGAIIQPIRTFYSGVLFRSKKEAQTAVFFDMIGWPWFYEPMSEIIDEEGHLYTPDFAVFMHSSLQYHPPNMPASVIEEQIKQTGQIMLPPDITQEEERQIWISGEGIQKLARSKQLTADMALVEVKANEPTMEERQKMSLLVKKTGKFGIILYGSSVEEPFSTRNRQGLKAIVMFPGEVVRQNTPFCFAQCPYCSRIELTFMGREELVRCSCRDKKEGVETRSHYFDRLSAAYDIASRSNFLY